MTPNLLRIFAWIFILFTVVYPFTLVPNYILFMAVPAAAMLYYQLSFVTDRTERQNERIWRLEQQLERMGAPEPTAK